MRKRTIALAIVAALGVAGGTWYASLDKEPTARAAFYKQVQALVDAGQ